MKKNNAGISIVEVVVVVAILAILTATGIYSISQINGFRAREGANTIASSLSQARVSMLGKAKSNGDMAWEIYCKDNKYYVRTVYNITGTEYYRDEAKIADGRVTVKYGFGTLNSSNNSVNPINNIVIGNNQAYRVYFNRSTGAVCDDSGAELSGDLYFRVEQGNKDYDVFIVSKTGKIISQSIKK